jgi:hypothetical protein
MLTEVTSFCTRRFLRVLKLAQECAVMHVGFCLSLDLKEDEIIALGYMWTLSDVFPLERVDPDWWGSLHMISSRKLARDRSCSDYPGVGLSFGMEQSLCRPWELGGPGRE